MSGRPSGVKVGDRVRITTVHTGTVTHIDDDRFMLELKPGRPIHGSFHGDGEMTWEVQRPEPPDGAVVRIGTHGPIFDRDDSECGGALGDARWLGFGPDAKPNLITWNELCKLGIPVELVPRRDAWSVPVASGPCCQSEPPPVGSVVIDKNGLAWQRGDVDNEVPWWAADGDEYDRSWDSLNDERGPLTVIYEGDGRC